MGYSISIVNNIRANSSEEYQNRIPYATRQNITSVGIALESYDLLYTEFFPALFGKIGKTILEKKLFQNKLARFKSGTIHNQQDVEEIFIEMAKAEGKYDPTGPNPLGRREGPDVKAIYHRMNRQDYYAMSIGDLDVVRVFRSEGTLDAFISGLINSVYSGANYDEWVAMKNLLLEYTPNYTQEIVARVGMDDDGTFYVLTTDPATLIETQFASFANVDEANTFCEKLFIKQIRNLVMDMSFPSSKYNKAKVMTWTNPENLVLFIKAEKLANIDVDVLSKAFNMGKTDIQVEIIPIDDFGMPGEGLGFSDHLINAWRGAVGLLVDKDFFRIWDTLSKMEPQRNAQGLFTNYFYHVHQILSLSRFKNAVLLTEGTVN